MLSCNVFSQIPTFEKNGLKVKTIDSRAIMAGGGGGLVIIIIIVHIYIAHFLYDTQMRFTTLFGGTLPDC